ncbi:aldehyde-activating protein [Chitinispirillum alkaliphilum]|nr:aldehyde-activating protein [Chitinispirillum alkaliphilum]
MDMKGSCLCGQISFQLKSDPLFSALCHCKACQKSSGSAFSFVIGVKKSDLQLEGTELKIYECTGDSGSPAYRHFCANCGSIIYGQMKSQPDVVFLRAGLLDDLSGIKPKMNVYWRDHLPWLSDLTGIHSFDLMPG